MIKLETKKSALHSALSVFAVFGITACSTTANYQPEHFSAGASLELLEELSADELEGREAGTAGGAAARAIIIQRLKQIGAQSVSGTYEHPFIYGGFSDPETGKSTRPDKNGVNIVGYLPGTIKNDIRIVISAHYDHLGIRDGEIFNGADDNASGVVGALAVAEHFAKTPPQHDVMFVFFDAEEDGFGGARDFIANPIVPLSSIALNLNFDMVSRGDNQLLWASGTHHWPDMVARVMDVAESAPVNVRLGYDQGDGRDDWTMLSDHAVFFRAGIPHIYFGVEDHPDYHRPTDDFENIDQSWFLRSVDTLIMMAEAMDSDLAEIYEMRLAAEN